MVIRPEPVSDLLTLAFGAAVARTSPLPVHTASIEARACTPPMSPGPVTTSDARPRARRGEAGGAVPAAGPVARPAAAARQPAAGEHAGGKADVRPADGMF